ncbi:MAG: hypothetical protein WC679_00315 [Bacteroidales bacterium]|jgi:hypothetical protein
MSNNTILTKEQIMELGLIYPELHYLLQLYNDDILTWDELTRTIIPYLLQEKSVIQDKLLKYIIKYGVDDEILNK